MSQPNPGPAPSAALPPSDVTELLPLVRRVIAARVRDAHAVDDLVQEAVSRLLAARSRIEDETLEAYAIVTAHHVVSTARARDAAQRRNLHRVLDPRTPEQPDEEIEARERAVALAEALNQLPPDDREALLEHEVARRDTATLAAERHSTPGAVAALLGRARARLRVEYLLALEHETPPSDRCRPVLLALSASDRRRQRELDVGRHLLDCCMCGRLSQPLLERRRDVRSDRIVSVDRDADVVRARQVGRQVAAEAGFSPTAQTLLATAISEIARNIVRFTAGGEIVVAPTDDGTGVVVVARDRGPGIADVGTAMRDGFSTYGGLGLGLPGARRLMDEFEIVSEIGRGTTITMTKWRERP